MKCLIVDDEPLAREGLSKYVLEIDFLMLVGTASNPVELNSMLSKTEVDLIFLDIQMPLMNGIEYLKVAKNPPLVVITTAYPNYALEGYQLDVIDYLLKPITFNRFFKAVTKANRQFQLINNNNADHESDTAGQDKYFFIKCNQKYERIYFDDILFVEAMQNYVHIHTESKKYTTLLFLKNVEKSLPPDRFLRVHKSYIISLSKVDQIDQGELIIREHRIPISRPLKKEVVHRVLKGKVL